MARKAANPTLVMLVQQLKPECWQHSTDPVFVGLLEQAHAANGLPKDDPTRVDVLRETANAITEYLVALLESVGLVVEEAHCILHGDDTQLGWDDVTASMVEVLKYLHLHLLLKFKSRDTSAAIEKLAAILGVEVQYVELDKSRGGAPVEVCGKKITQQHDNGLAYLTHVKYADKFQYPPEQVATVRGMGYQQVYRERYTAWRKGRAHVKAKRAKLEFEAFREMVLQGELTRDQIMLTDEYFDIYSRHQREIDDALSAYGQRRAYRAAAKLRAGEFSTQVVFIHGDAGVGKTRFANAFIQEAISCAKGHGERWQVYRAATTNPLDDWRGEEIMLLDDLRASAMDANDWLLLLDPHNASPARARYKNKGEVAPRLIVITATIEPVEFFFYARQKGNVDEALDQFIRRLQSVVRVYREDDILRYLVQPIGKVEPYRLGVRNKTSGYYVSSEWLSLSYGPESKIDHDADGAVSELLDGLAEHSPDVPLALPAGRSGEATSTANHLTDADRPPN
ncbi:plasmid replication-like protein [Brevibacterium metallidurans]